MVIERYTHMLAVILTQRGTTALVQGQSKDSGRLLPLEKGRAH